MRLDRWMAGLGLVAGLVLLAGEARAGATLDRVMSTKMLVEVTDPSYPPFSFMNDQNEMAGFDVDVTRALAERLGVGFKVEGPSWEVITAGHWNGRWDICVCSMTPTQERAEVLDFPVQYYGAPATVVVNQGDERIKGAADLTGKKVGVEAGTTYERYLNKALVIPLPDGTSPTIAYPFGEVQIAPYPSETEAFQDLGLGAGKRLDAMVTGLLTARERIEKDGKFQTVGGALYQEPIFVATDKGDPEFDAKVTALIQAMHEDGTLTKISMKWLGIDVTQP